MKLGQSSGLPEKEEAVCWTTLPFMAFIETAILCYKIRDSRLQLGVRVYFSKSKSIEDFSFIVAKLLDDTSQLHDWGSLCVDPNSFKMKVIDLGTLSIPVNSSLLEIQCKVFDVAHTYIRLRYEHF
ncbi:unnamed protein product [Allacma fusca]|uniref:Uncharacterized protein n=1 Tax=Allacma fusca TaxID=39272 RepID=A0A8J2NX91_9HEXA|nr:unnamed protein product [Allacma fusca]